MRCRVRIRVQVVKRTVIESERFSRRLKKKPPNKLTPQAMWAKINPSLSKAVRKKQLCNCRNARCRRPPRVKQIENALQHKKIMLCRGIFCAVSVRSHRRHTIFVCIVRSKSTYAKMAAEGCAVQLGFCR